MANERIYSIHPTRSCCWSCSRVFSPCSSKYVDTFDEGLTTEPDARAQTFFAFRIRALSGRWPITVICCLLNVLALTFSLILVVVFWRGDGFPVLREKQNLWIVATASCVVPATNILTAISICYYLWKIQNPQAGFTKCVLQTPLSYATPYANLV